MAVYGGGTGGRLPPSVPGNFGDFLNRGDGEMGRGGELEATRRNARGLLVKEQSERAALDADRHPFSGLTERIIACAIEVHKTLGLDSRRFSTSARCTGKWLRQGWMLREK
jgi:hypothetical protein